jgi:hypothetical protein
LRRAQFFSLSVLGNHSLGASSNSRPISPGPCVSAAAVRSRVLRRVFFPVDFHAGARQYGVRLIASGPAMPSANVGVLAAGTSECRSAP